MAAHLVLKFSTYPMGLISVHHGTVSPQYRTQLSNTDNGCMHATAPVSRCACDNRESVRGIWICSQPNGILRRVRPSAGFPYGTLSWQSALTTGHCMGRSVAADGPPKQGCLLPWLGCSGLFWAADYCQYVRVFYGFRCNYTLSLRLDNSYLSHTTTLLKLVLYFLIFLVYISIQNV